MKMHIEVYVPDGFAKEFAKEWLQHIRDFDVRYPGCVFKVLAAAPDMTVDAMRESMESVEPGFASIRVRRWAKE